MQFQDYLHAQLERHPSMQPQDIVKLCYQAAFGAEHLLLDIDKAKTYFFAEYASISASDNELYEEISPSVCRVNLAAWKLTGMPEKWLFNMFVASTDIQQGGQELFLKYLKLAEETLTNNVVAFTSDEWQTYLKQYKEAGIHAVHHSQIYRENEHPAYRIIDKRFLRLLPILQKAATLSSEKSAKVIAIDGRAASGKSTIAEYLRQVLNAGLIHVDDFFLPPHLRNLERFKEPGGNVHYERFAEEILPHISNTEPFSYRIFDCSKLDYHGLRTVATSQWRIVEGAYSCHPYFGNYADLKVFSDIDADEQMERIIKRNGVEMAKRFQTEWIPLEEDYYRFYKIKENADIEI